MAGKPRVKRLEELKVRFSDGQGMTIQDMIDDFGVTRRTANRDLAVLSELGMKLRSEETKSGTKIWFAAHQSRGRYQVTYTLEDIMALFMGRRLFDFVSKTSFEDRFNEVYRKIETQLTRAEDLETVNAIARKVFLIHEGPKKLPPSTRDILEECLTGLLREQKLEIIYLSSDNREARLVIEPYTLAAYKRGLYLVGAQDNDPSNVKTYSLERMRTARWLKGANFQYPKYFDPKRYFDKALFVKTGTPSQVILRFKPEMRSYIQFRNFHKSQTIQALPDGGIEMKLLVPAGRNDFEVVNWVLSFGDRVEVISPKSLRDAVQWALKRAIAQYAAGC